MIDLGKYVDQKVRVRFQGGREGKLTPNIFSISPYDSNVGNYLVEGLLKGFDKLDNLVLDDCIEFLRGNISDYITLGHSLQC